jgi:hypothetical protein
MSAVHSMASVVPLPSSAVTKQSSRPRAQVRVLLKDELLDTMRDGRLADIAIKVSFTDLEITKASWEMYLT